MNDCGTPTWDDIVAWRGMAWRSVGVGVGVAWHAVYVLCVCVSLPGDWEGGGGTVVHNLWRFQHVCKY